MKRPDGRDHHAGHHRQTRKRRSALAIAFLLVLLAGLMASAGTGQAALIHEFDSYFGGGSLSNARSPRRRSDDRRPLRPRTWRRLRLPLLRGTRRARSSRTARLHRHRDEPDLRPSSSVKAPRPPRSRSTTREPRPRASFYVNSPLRNGVGGDARLRRRRQSSRPNCPRTAKTTSAASPRTADRRQSTSRSTTRGSGNTPTTTRSPTPTSSAGAYEGPICGIARASTGSKYNVFEPNGPVIKLPPSTVLRDATYALTLDPSSDDVYLSEGGVVTGAQRRRDPVRQFGSGDVTEARGVAVDEVSGTAYVSDTPNGRIADLREAIAPTGSKSNPRGPGSARSPPTLRRSKTAATTGSAPGTTCRRPSSSKRRPSLTRKSTAGPGATTSTWPATNAASKSPPPTARSSRTSPACSRRSPPRPAAPAPAPSATPTGSARSRAAARPAPARVPTTRARRSTSSPPRPATRRSPAGRATAPTSRARATSSSKAPPRSPPTSPPSTR